MSDDALMEFKSRIEGKNAEVAIYSDHIEWLAGKGMSGGKLSAAFLTGGLSLAATGVRKRRAGSEMIPIKAVSSVTTEKDGMRHYIVKVVTTGNTIGFRCPKSEAETAAALLKQLMLGTHPSQQTPSPAMPAAPPPAPAVPATGQGGGQDVPTRLRELAALRDEGLLTDEEFQTQKQQLLG